MKVELVVLVFVIFDVVISTGGAVVDRVVDSTSRDRPDNRGRRTASQAAGQREPAQDEHAGTKDD
ncbi:MAG TPA: hypothetical protein VKO84_10175 [Gaiellaceae bacterium]|nr:hypothetical protein [Gaiellaceae bacterium]